MSERKRTRTSREEWAKRVQRWERSGRTADAFGAEIGVNGRTLAYWKWLLRKQAQGKAHAWPTRSAKQRKSASAAPSFVEVRAGTAESRFALELGDGRRLLIPRDFDTDGLRRLLGALEGA